MSGGSTIYRNVDDGVCLNPFRTMNLQQIADSGQCFRLTPLSDGGFIAVTGDHMVKISQTDNGGYHFHCSEEIFQSVWFPYFDLGTNYRKYQDQMQDDSFLLAAVNAGMGIRILQQDLWEMVITFVISQRNNIPRIRSAVETLCKEFGSCLGEIDGQKVFSFPTAEQLRGKDLSAVSLGYREPYIKALTTYGEETWDEIKQMDDTHAKDALISMKGIGEKVANCIMLYGLHRMSSYPKDVWINRMIDDVYGGKFDASKYCGFAGYVQQLQFYYYRKMTKEGGA